MSFFALSRLTLRLKTPYYRAPLFRALTNSAPLPFARSGELFEDVLKQLSGSELPKVALQKNEELAEARFRDLQTSSIEDMHNPTAPITEFPVSERLQQRLTRNGITHFFPVQAQCFRPIQEGRDLIVRSRTGTGKTLAFCLPLVERLLTEPRAKPGHVKVLILEPTRELARQVIDEIHKLVSPGVLRCAAIYGGVSYYPQAQALEAGMDIAVVTPGRAIDHLNSGKLDLSNTRVLVLDEADRMLEIGFQESLDTLLRNAPPPSQRQTLLFSATIPPWIADVSRNYLRSPTTINLVGNSALQVPKGIVHYAMVSPPSVEDRVSIIEDLLATHSSPDGRVIIFSETKSDCDMLASHPRLRSQACALHGDVSQARREQSLSRFKSREFRLLIATDVAARGLDIPDVEMIIHTCFPREAEQYIHRAGRTGRAGKAGKSILLVSPDERRMLSSLSKRIGASVTMIFPSSPSQDQLQTRLSEVPSQNAMAMVAPARNLLSKYGLDNPDAHRFATEVLAPLLVHSRCTVARSLLGSAANFVTILLQRQRPIYYADALHAINSLLTEQKISPVYGRVECFKDTAAVDVDAGTANHIRLQLQANGKVMSRDTTISIPETLPQELVAGLTSGRSADFLFSSSQAGRSSWRPRSGGFSASSRPNNRPGSRASSFGRP